MVNKEVLCVECSQVITNPICEQCHLKEVEFWLHDVCLDSLARSIILETIKRRSNHDTLNEGECILCNQNPLSICSYCFFLICMRTMIELNVSSKILGNFKEIFSYDSRHSEYIIV
ncbi:MAG: hypothetical protein U9Q06_03925 [Nanoarchaeota archaeon]|nr:hypothetical protein [Nanoarchaeota archaeon]